MSQSVWREENMRVENAIADGHVKCASVKRRERTATKGQRGIRLSTGYFRARDCECSMQKYGQNSRERHNISRVLQRWKANLQQGKRCCIMRGPGNSNKLEVCRRISDQSNITRHELPFLCGDDRALRSGPQGRLRAGGPRRFWASLMDFIRQS